MLLPGHGGDPGFGVVIDPFRRFVSGSFVGIELERASCRRGVTSLTPFGCEVGSHSRHDHVSRGPPIIPDGRISQGPVRSLGLSSLSLPSLARFKR
jgi:hypothetical protein